MDVESGQTGRLGAGNVAGGIVAGHDGAGGVQMVLLQQQIEKAEVGLFAAAGRGEIDRVKDLVQAQGPHLIGGKDGLCVGEQIEPGAFPAKHLEHFQGAVVQAEIFGGHGPEELSRMDGKGQVGVGALLGKEGQKNFLDLNLGEGLVAVPAQPAAPGCPLLGQTAVGLLQFFGGIDRSVIAVKPGQSRPGGGVVLIGVNVHQGSV